MLCLVRKCDYFRLYAWAITRADTLDLSVVKGRIRQTRAKDLMCLLVGVGDEAIPLFERSWLEVQVRELMEIILTALNRHDRKVDRPTVDAHRCTSFHPICSDAQFLELFRQSVRCWFRDSSCGDLCSSSVDEACEEGAGGQHDTLRLECRTHAGDDTPHFIILDDETDNGVLPDIQVFGIFQDTSPFLAEFLSVGL